MPVRRLVPEKEKMSKLVGKLLTSPKFREDFKENPDKVLKVKGITFDAAIKNKLIMLNQEVIAGKLGRDSTALHCEVASSVGYA